MQKEIKNNLNELNALHDKGCLFFTFVEEPEGVCIHAKDEASGVDVYMKHLSYKEAKTILLKEYETRPDVIVIKPDSQLYALYRKLTNAS